MAFTAELWQGISILFTPNKKQVCFCNTSRKKGWSIGISFLLFIFLYIFLNTIIWYYFVEFKGEKDTKQLNLLLSIAVSLGFLGFFLIASFFLELDFFKCFRKK